MTRISITEDCAGAPTLDEVRQWPATVSVPTACAAAGISASHGYELVKSGAFPFRVLSVRGRVRVVTASILAELGQAEPESA